MAKPKKKVVEPCITLPEIEAETRKLASKLAFCARRPVNIQLVGGQHIAFTYDTDQTKRTVQIVMNPSILEKVRNKERAIQIWHGIGFHELAHHLWPAGEQYKIAHKEGFRDLFNLIDDEQNERRGRAFDHTWGACFQSVCAFIFPGKKQSSDKLNTGIIDGDKPAAAPKGRAADRTYAQRWNRFAYHLRRHIPNCPDAVVAEALEQIPKRFMDLTKDELLELTRQIHEILARGIKRVEESTEQKGEEPEPEDEEDDKKEDDKNADVPDGADDDDDKSDDEGDEDPDKGESAGARIKKLFTSKWLYIPLVGFIMAWFALLMQGGVNFWFRVFITTVVVVGVVGTFLYLRRAYIKAMLKAIADARKRAAMPPPTAGPPAPKTNKTKIILAAAITLTLFGGLAYILIKALPLSIAGLALGAIAIFFLIGLIRRKYKDARAKEQNIDRLSMLLIGLGSLGSAAIMVYSLREMGMGPLYVALAGLVLLILCCVGLFYLVSDKRSAATRAREEAAEKSAGTWKPSLWKRAKHAAIRTKDRLWEAFKKPAKSFLGFIWKKIIAAFFMAVWTVIAWIAVRLWRGISWVAVRVWKGIVFVATRSWKAITAAARRVRWNLRGPLLKAWKNPITRVAMLALPIAILLVMFYAVIMKAGTYGWWVAAIVLLLLLLLLLLGWLYRKKIVKFIVTEMFMPMPQLMDVSMIPPLDMHTEWFNQIDDIRPIQADQAFWDELLPQIYPLAQQLRPLLAKCGRVSIDREDQPDGYDLIDEAELLLVGETAVFVDDDSTPKASVHLEIGLDCSGSMASPTVSLKPGQKFILGKFFALVLEQAVINLPGVSAHFWGFTDSVIFDCGLPGEGRISGLQCGGGNNDSAMLWHMGQSAAASGKDVKILLMLSDGQPSECSWLSLKNLVLQFEQEGMIPWNFALDVIHTPAFERFFTDLVGQSMDQAIVTMGETLAALAAEGI